MDQATGSVLRWGRATVLALVAVVAGSVAHTSADGLLPGWPVLLLVAAATALACQPLLARPASTGRVVAIAVGAQTAVHLALSVTAGHRGDHAAPLRPVQPLPPVTLGDAHAAADLGASGPAQGPSLAESLAGLATDLPMMLLHLVAAAVVGLWLARGERALWSLLTLVWRFVALPVTAVPLTPARRVVVRRRTRPAPLLRVLARVVPHRGPPALLAR